MFAANWGIWGGGGGGLNIFFRDRNVHQGRPYLAKSRTPTIVGALNRVEDLSKTIEAAILKRVLDHDWTLNCRGPLSLGM